MAPIISCGQVEFANRFLRLMPDMRNFLSESYEIPTKTSLAFINTCIEINKRSATTQGAKHVPLLRIEQVNNFLCRYLTVRFYVLFFFIFFLKAGLHDPRTTTNSNQSQSVPHCIVYHDGSQLGFSEESPGTMLAFCGDHVYKIEGIKCESEVFFNLFSLYYIFDVKYPACYSLMTLLDMLCLSSNQTGVKPPPKKKPPSVPSKLGKFVKSFQEFRSQKERILMMAGEVEAVVTAPSSEPEDSLEHPRVDDVSSEEE